MPGSGMYEPAPAPITLVQCYRVRVHFRCNMFRANSCHMFCCMIFAYADAFIVNDTIPLWPLWEQYFSQCAVGSYTIAIHQQYVRTSEGQHQRIRNNIRKVGGRCVLHRL